MKFQDVLSALGGFAQVMLTIAAVIGKIIAYFLNWLHLFLQLGITIAKATSSNWRITSTILILKKKIISS